MWSSWPFGRYDSKRFLVDSWASTMHACVVSGMLLDSITLRFSLPKPSASLFLFSRHCRLHWNFHLRSCVFDGFFIFTIFWIDEINASQSSNIDELWLLVCPFLLLFLLIGFSQFLDQTSDHKFSGLVVAWICVSLLLRHIFPLGGFSFIKVNFVNPFQESDKLRFASTFKLSSTRCSCNKSRFLWAALVTSMYLSGIGNVSSFDTWSWTRGSMWWR